MMHEDFHMHTTFSDGSNSVEEMVEAMMALGARRMGISDHGFASYDDVCMMKEQIPAYKETVRAVAERYKDRIEVLCGIEQDIFSEASTEGYDYVIGSVHYLKVNDAYYTIDDQVETIHDLAKNCFGGDYLCVCEQYFDTVARVVKMTDCDIIGHFDLVSKLNQKYHLFDEHDERYVRAWKKAADALLKTKRLFEINTGALDRYRDVPYPAPEMISYIAEHGGKFILSSDSHKAERLSYGFATWKKWAEENGIALQSLKR